jgi:hypothetical protein
MSVKAQVRTTLSLTGCFSQFKLFISTTVTPEQPPVPSALHELAAQPKPKHPKSIGLGDVSGQTP